MTDTLPRLTLHGVDHTAFPTAKPRETIEFYRDIMGLPVLHAITAKGWGWKGGYPDFFHFFFDAGNGSTIAFFFHIGSPPPEMPSNPLGYQAQARHTAWSVETAEEMNAWYERLKAKGVKVIPTVRHELIESIYFLDPNSYPLEITRRLRDLEPIDSKDAELSLEAIAEIFPTHESTRKIDDMWRRKAEKVRSLTGFDPEGRLNPSIYVLNIAEYAPLLDFARKNGLTLTPINEHYTCLSAERELVLNRKAVNLIEALWFSLLVGGLNGTITRYDSDELRISA